MALRPFRYSLNLTEHEDEWLRAESHRRGIPRSHIMYELLGKVMPPPEDVRRALQEIADRQTILPHTERQAKDE